MLRTCACAPTQASSLLKKTEGVVTLVVCNSRKEETGTAAAVDHKHVDNKLKQPEKPSECPDHLTAFYPFISIWIFPIIYILYCVWGFRIIIIIQYCWYCACGRFSVFTTLLRVRMYVCIYINIRDPLSLFSDVNKKKKCFHGFLNRIVSIARLFVGPLCSRTAAGSGDRSDKTRRRVDDRDQQGQSRLGSQHRRRVRYIAGKWIYSRVHFVPYPY